MTEDRADYLASGAGEPPADRERLDMIRGILADEAVWSEPPPEVGDAVLESIAAASQPVESETTTQRKSLRWLAGVAATAALVIVAVGLYGLFTADTDELVVSVEGTELETAASGEATLRPTGDGWWIRLEVQHLPPAQPGTYYEGWVWSDDGDGVSIGTFHMRGEGQAVTLWSGVDPADYPSIWVTLEDEDGDPAASDRVVMRGRIEDRGS